MAAKLTHIIEFVADMDRAVTFYRDVVGLTLEFQSPAWSEFDTGEISLALHPASDTNPVGPYALVDISESYASIQSSIVLFRSSFPPMRVISSFT